MSEEIPVEKRFRILVEICRASHFAWREAVARRCPGIDPAVVVNEMWDVTGVQTAESYLAHLDPAGDLARQVAASVVWSSVLTVLKNSGSSSSPSGTLKCRCGTVFSLLSVDSEVR